MVKEKAIQKKDDRVIIKKSGMVEKFYSSKLMDKNLHKVRDDFNYKKEFIPIDKTVGLMTGDDDTDGWLKAFQRSIEDSYSENQHIMKFMQSIPEISKKYTVKDFKIVLPGGEGIEWIDKEFDYGNGVLYPLFLISRESNMAQSEMQTYDDISTIRGINSGTLQKDRWATHDDDPLEDKVNYLTNIPFLKHMYADNKRAIMTRLYDGSAYNSGYLTDDMGWGVQSDHNILLDEYNYTYFSVILYDSTLKKELLFKPQKDDRTFLNNYTYCDLILWDELIDFATDDAGGIDMEIIHDSYEDQTLIDTDHIGEGTENENTELEFEQLLAYFIGPGTPKGKELDDLKKYLMERIPNFAELWTNNAKEGNYTQAKLRRERLENVQDWFQKHDPYNFYIAGLSNSGWYCPQFLYLIEYCKHNKIRPGYIKNLNCYLLISDESLQDQINNTYDFKIQKNMMYKYSFYFPRGFTEKYNGWGWIKPYEKIDKVIEKDLGHNAYSKEFKYPKQESEIDQWYQVLKKKKEKKKLSDDDKEAYKLARDSKWYLLGQREAPLSYSGIGEEGKTIDDYKFGESTFANWASGYRDSKDRKKSDHPIIINHTGVLFPRTEDEKYNNKFLIQKQAYAYSRMFEEDPSSWAPETAGFSEYPF